MFSERLLKLSLTWRVGLSHYYHTAPAIQVESARFLASLEATFAELLLGHVIRAFSRFSHLDSLTFLFPFFERVDIGIVLELLH